MTATTPPGRIGRTHADSQPWYDAPARPQAGAPDVVIAVLDDVGFADLGCFGSEIRTPTADRLAAGGLRYSNFHTTTLCSPTRACLLTGRNHHAVGMRFLSNVDMGWPSGRGAITRRAATLAELLRAAGYGTFAIGKWHLAPTEDGNAAGPFDEWPLGRGFERFYGFMNGSTDQYFPELVHDNHLIDAPGRPEDGYHLTEDMIGHAIFMLSNQISLRPQKPFFLYIGLGAGHFPHQAPRDYIDSYAGVFDAGWDVIRAQRFARQMQSGLIPADTVLPSPNEGVEPWDRLSPDQRRVALRLQQAYAGFMEYTDLQLGRLTAFLERVGRLDNTLFVLLSDNGASIDCGPDGTTNVTRWFNHIPDTIERNLAEIDLIGGPESFTNYPWGWAQASSTPNKLYKSYTHAGGVRDPLIVHWPRGIRERGGVRRQFLHAIDIAPTVLELCGVTPPETFNGVPQMPLHGASVVDSFADPDAPARRDVQYFEMYGHRGIWHDGWKAVTNHRPGASFDTETWELYHLDADFAEARDLAAERPDKLRELMERWWTEAGRYDVLPLDDRRETLFKPRPKPWSVRAPSRFVYYPPIAPIPSEAAPLTTDVSHRIDVEVEREAGDEGALVAFGNRHSGYALLIQNGRLIYGYNYCGEETVLVSDRPVPAGKARLTFVFEKTGTLKGRARLEIDGRQAGSVDIPRTLLRISLQPLQIGRSGVPPVLKRYAGRFAFTGRIERVIFELGDDREVAPKTLDVD
jgi:arylsulfatase